VGYINELVTAKSGELSFASGYEFLRVSNGTPETLVIRVNNIISHVPPVVKMDGTTLTYRLTWHETDYIYDHYYAIPINTQVGEHTLTVNGEANALYLPLNGNTFTYKGGGPGIVTFNDIKLGAVNGQESTGSVFSSTFGTIYKTSQIPPYAAHNIDIAYVGINGMQFFEAPSKVQEWGLTAIPNPTETYFINYIESSGITFTPTMFDNMTDDSALRSLVINADNESFPSGSGAVPRIVLFSNAAGKKGVIKIKEVVGGVNGYIIFDLKVQE